MTQDGKLRHRVSSPRYKGGALGKVYEIKLERPLTGNEASIVEAGELKLRGEEKPLRYAFSSFCSVLIIIRPAVFEVVNAEEHLVRMTLYEGRYHQIRRMLAAMGNRAAEIKVLFHLLTSFRLFLLSASPWVGSNLATWGLAITGLSLKQSSSS